MNKLALGTAQFGLDYGISNKKGKVPHETVRDIIKAAYLADIKFLDTAALYGNSELILGQIGVKNFKIIGKIPKLIDTDISYAKVLLTNVKESLFRLNIKFFEALLFHSPTQLMQSNSGIYLEALKSLKDLNLVKKIGISIYTKNNLPSEKLLKSIDIIQLPLNIVNRSLDENGTLKKLKDYNIEIHARSVFLQGLLLIPYDDLSDYFSPWKPQWRQWHKDLIKHNTNPLRECLLFVKKNQYVDKVIVGVTSVKELKQIIESFNYPTSGMDNEFMRNNDERLINPQNWKTE